MKIAIRSSVPLLLATVLIMLSVPRLGFGEPGADAAASGVLKLANGDSLQGEPVEVNAAGRLVWRHPLLGSIVSVKITDIKEIRIGKRAAAKDQAGVRLHFTNGDKLSADLVSVDNANCVASVRHAGKVTFPAAMLSGMVFVRDKKAPPLKTADQPKVDAVYLNNGDRITGSFASIAGGNLDIKSTFAPVKLPLARVQSIRFAEETRARARRTPTDVLVFFRDGGRVTGSFAGMKGGEIKLASDNLGRAAFELDTIKRVRFNIYRFGDDPNQEGTPLWAWRKFYRACKSGDGPALRRIAAPKVVRDILDDNLCFDDQGYCAFAMNLTRRTVNDEVVVSIEALSFDSDMDVDEAVRVEMTHDGDRWIVQSIKDHGHSEASVSQVNRNRLDDVVDAVESYSDEKKKLPRSLAELRPRYIDEPETLLWTHPKTGKTRPWLYCAGFYKDWESVGIVAAAPEPHNGQRTVGFRDWTIVRILDAELRYIAQRDKWPIGLGARAAPAAAAVPAPGPRLAAIVKELTQADYKTRLKAREKLRALLTEDRRILTPYRNHPDPEVRLTIRQLLDG